MKDPIVMKKAQEEIRNIGGKKGFRDEDDIEKLPYLKALTKETMKLHPPIPLIPRATPENCSVNGCEVPPKTLVFVNAWAIGRDPESRENPHEFNPERFLGTFIDFKGQHYGLMAFRAGRRGCPGIYLRTVIIQLALGNLLYSFDWEMPNGMTKEDIDTDVKHGVTMLLNFINFLSKICIWNQFNNLCYVIFPFSIIILFFLVASIINRDTSRDNLANLLETSLEVSASCGLVVYQLPCGSSNDGSYVSTRHRKIYEKYIHAIPLQQNLSDPSCCSHSYLLGNDDS